MLSNFLRWLFGGSGLPDPPPDPPPPPSGTMPPGPLWAGDLLDSINEERERHSLPRLREALCLTNAAAVHAQHMASSGRLSHDGFPSRLGACGYRSGGEVVACGQLTPDEAVAAWLASPGHRRQLLSVSHRVCGVGSTAGYWVAIFGS